jgi:nucleotide-binding universal stress UspA family protein
MAHGRIVVGLDGSSPSRQALRWAVRRVTALCHAAKAADLVVVGSDEGRGLRGTSVAARLAGRLADRRGHGELVPPIVVPTAVSVPVWAPVAA